MKYNTFESFLSTDNLKKSKSLVAAVLHASKHFSYWNDTKMEFLNC